MAWYKQGTIAISGKTVTGTGTNWTDNKMSVGAGQALLIPGTGVVKLYEIARVNSATSMTLDTDAGTVPAGSPYAIMSFYTESRPDFNRRLAAQLAYYQSQMDGWQNIMTGSGSVTIEAPDGTTVTISSFKKLTDDMAKKVNKTDIGTAAGYDVGELSSNVMRPGMFGVGRPDGALTFNTNNQDVLLAGLTGYGLVSLRNNQQIDSGNLNGWQLWNYSPTLFMRTGDTFGLMCLPIENNGSVTIWSGTTGSGWSSSRRMYDNRNTTVDPNGFIKRASPVVKIFSDGAFETNDESNGAAVERLGTGVYKIEGVLGMNSDASWGGVDGGFSIPMDRNNLAKIWLDYKVCADGSVLVKTYHRTHPAAPEFAQNNVEGLNEGDPVDIPADQFVSVRVQMPEVISKELRE